MLFNKYITNSMLFYTNPYLKTTLPPIVCFMLIMLFSNYITDSMFYTNAIYNCIKYICDHILENRPCCHI